MSEYYLFVDADKNTSRAVELRDLKAGESVCRVSIPNKTVSFRTDGGYKEGSVSCTIPIPDDILNNDDDIATAVDAARRRQIEHAKKLSEKRIEDSVEKDDRRGDRHVDYHEEPLPRISGLGSGEDGYNYQMQGELQNLRRDYSNLNSRYQDSQASNDKLRRDQVALKRDYDALRQDVDALKAQLALQTRALLDLQNVLIQNGFKPLQPGQ